ncbi:hypothetical protein MRX96_046757 [Rhipicephalus microplus]
MPVRIADYRVIATTYAQVPRLIFAHVVASNIHPRNLLARLSAFCERALILPALDHAKDAAFASHANRQNNLKRCEKNWFYTGTTSLSCCWGPLNPANTSKPEPSRLNKTRALPVLPPSTHRQLQRLPVYKTPWPSLMRRQRQPKQNQAARVEAAALRERMAKLEAQISTLATSRAIPTTPTPTTS